MNNKDLVKKLQEVKILDEQNEQQVERAIAKNNKTRNILENYYEKDEEKIDLAMANIEDMLDKVSRKKINDKGSSKGNYEQAVMKAYGNDMVKTLFQGLIPEGESLILSLIEKTIKHVNKSKWKETTLEIDYLLSSKIPIVKEKNPTWLPALIVYLVKLKNRIQKINEFDNGEEKEREKDEPFAEDVRVDFNDDIGYGYDKLKLKLESTRSGIKKATDLKSLAIHLDKLSKRAADIVRLTDAKNGRGEFTKLTASGMNRLAQLAGFNTAELKNISSCMSAISGNEFSDTEEINRLQELLEDYKKKVAPSNKSSTFLFPKLRTAFAIVSIECLKKAEALRAGIKSSVEAIGSDYAIEKSPSPKDDTINGVVNTLSTRLVNVSTSLRQSTTLSDVSDNLKELAQIASDIRGTTHAKENHTSIETKVRDVSQSIAYWMGYDPNTLTGICNGLSSLSAFVSQLKNSNSDISSKIAELGSKIEKLLNSLQVYNDKVQKSSNKSFKELRENFSATAMGCIGMVRDIVTGLTSESIKPEFVNNLLKKLNDEVNQAKIPALMGQICRHNNGTFGEEDAKNCAKVITDEILSAKKEKFIESIAGSTFSLMRKKGGFVGEAIANVGTAITNNFIASSENISRGEFNKNILESFKEFVSEKDMNNKATILGGIKKQIANKVAEQFGYNIDEGRLVIGYDISEGISLQEYSKLVANSAGAVAAAAICKNFKSWIAGPLLKIKSIEEKREILKAKRNLMQLNMLMYKKFGDDQVKQLSGCNGGSVNLKDIGNLLDLEKLQNFNEAFESNYSDLQKSLEKYNAGWISYANIDATVQEAWGNFYEKIEGFFPNVKCKYNENDIQELDKQIKALEGI
ncbi:MAG: hypothetical protein ACI4PR_01555 [Acutalibacteraceae bacterium]